MKKTMKKSVLFLLTPFVVGAVVGATTTFSANADTFEPQTFAMVDGASLALYDNGGLRFQVKMDEETKDYIVNNDEVTMSFILSKRSNFEAVMKAGGEFADLLSGDNKYAVEVEVDETKIYQYEDKNGEVYWFANGCGYDIPLTLKTTEYVATACILVNDDVNAYATGENGNYDIEKVSYSEYYIAQKAFLDVENEYYKDMLGLNDPEFTAYSWLGTEAYPIEIVSNDQLAALKTVAETVELNEVNAIIDGGKVTADIGTIAGVKAQKFYTVEFKDVNGETISVEKVNEGEMPTAPSHSVLAGYTFGWNSEIVSASMDAVYTETKTANTDTAYTVKHYQQNLENDEYTEVTADVENKTGTTDTDTQAEAKSYAGFTAKAFSQSKIAGDGKTVVEIYYDRNTFTIAWMNGEQTLETDANVKYGAMPSYDGAAPTKAADDFYYMYKGWDKTVAVATENVTYSATFDKYLLVKNNDAPTKFSTSVSVDLTQYYQLPPNGDVNVTAQATKGTIDGLSYTAPAGGGADTITITAQKDDVTDTIEISLMTLVDGFDIDANGHTLTYDTTVKYENQNYSYKLTLKQWNCKFDFSNLNAQYTNTHKYVVVYVYFDFDSSNSKFYKNSANTSAFTKLTKGQWNAITFTGEEFATACLDDLYILIQDGSINMTGKSLYISAPIFVDYQVISDKYANAVTYATATELGAGYTLISNEWDGIFNFTKDSEITNPNVKMVNVSIKTDSDMSKTQPKVVIGSTTKTSIWDGGKWYSFTLTVAEWNKLCNYDSGDAATYLRIVQQVWDTGNKNVNGVPFTMVVDMVELAYTPQSPSYDTEVVELLQTDEYGLGYRISVKQWQATINFTADSAITDETVETVTIYLKSEQESIETSKLAVKFDGVKKGTMTEAGKWYSYTLTVAEWNALCGGEKMIAIQPANNPNMNNVAIDMVVAFN